MSRTLVALLEHPPGIPGLTRALAAAGPSLRVRLVADGALVQLRDEAGQLVAAMHAAQRLTVSAEAERLLDTALPDTLPAQPWWVEARTTEAGLADPTTRQAMRRFADTLVEWYGGLVWQPEQHLPQLDGLPVRDTGHPVVAALTEEAAVVVEDRPVVPVSVWLADALAAQARQGRALQLVTPPDSRLTEPLATLLTAPLARWAVAVGDGFRDGFSGRPLHWDERYGLIADPPGTPVADSPLRTEPAPEETDHQLQVTLKADHPADPNLVLGQTVELLTETLAGAVPSLFGPTEPATLAWETSSLTGLCRDRSPRPSWLVFAGPPASVRPEGARAFCGTLRVRRTREGVRETVTLTVNHPPEQEPDLSALVPIVRELTEWGVLHVMEVRRRRGRADLARGPYRAGGLTPVGLALGVETVASLGADRALDAPVRAVPVGPPMTPAVWYDLTGGGDHDGGGWAGFGALLAHVNPDRDAGRQSPGQGEEADTDTVPVVRFRMPAAAD
ncbi:hypothetical protein KGD83_12155 [Nocardiopsis akebiae]|uniref:Uncharacterized protein n=1 Tax=Nocardiopsis akebiae TaxID=2831968 RepID=A0ABX8C9T1_9ACTN|nr:DUF6177 family protein [Nocardiopsis akebiae]QUX31172.1 hypothetical protein KGD83_12155 [Nocardiopsis akebiae]